ncbi:hypothetical protein MycrhDRAFT_5622 [Mycolicibacterium rhodesiae JS60]|nr:hypothetical protein MycrhDRAFT_5622 [Mycolicibacterium rhodesiae JS60]
MSAMSETMGFVGEIIYYHGGVPGKQVGDLLYPAADLGLDYTSAYGDVPGLRALARPKYRPQLVYFTTHFGSAQGYAARYVAGRTRTPGDVYAVRPRGRVERDPDFDHPKTAGVYVSSPDPVVVTDVVQRNVEMDRRQQNEACWPYRYYGIWEETHTADGTVLASAEMRAHGVSDEYLGMLPKWMDLSEFANDGALWKRDLPGWRADADEVLEMLSHLGIDSSRHLITSQAVKRAPFVEAGSRRPVLFGWFQCRECGATFGAADKRVDKQIVLQAAVHQAGDDLPVVAQFNGGLDGYLHAMLRRSPERWTWVDLPSRK